MDDVDVRYAKEHLEQLIERAQRGEVVRIIDPALGSVKISKVDVDTERPRKRRRLGLLDGKIPPPPDDFVDPMSEEELKLWYGDST